MTDVYIDLENALRVRFLSGIQRLVFEVVPRLLDLSGAEVTYRVVRHCVHCNRWLPVSRQELLDSLEGRNHRATGKAGIADWVATRAGLLRHPARRLRKLLDRFRHLRARHEITGLDELPRGSVFLDLDASWHNALRRDRLYAGLSKASVRIVAVSYDMIPLTRPEFVHEDTLGNFRNHVEAQARWCDRILCISEASSRSFSECTGRRQGVETIPLGDRFASRSGGGSSVASLPASPSRYLLCVGTIEPRKNYGVLLDAFDRVATEFPDLALVIVGRRGWASSATVERIRDHPLSEERVFWLQNCDDSSLQALYQGATLCVAPSLDEGYGLPVSEALASGCVTLASRAGAQPEAGGDFADYFDPEDIAGLCRLLRYYLGSNARLAEARARLVERPGRSWADTAAAIHRCCIEVAAA